MPKITHTVVDRTATCADQHTGKVGISWAGGLDRASGPNTGVDGGFGARSHGFRIKSP